MCDTSRHPRVANHVHAGVGNLLTDGVDEVEPVHLQHRRSTARVRCRLDAYPAAVQERQGAHCEHHARRVAGQTFETRALTRGETLRRLDRKARVCPRQEALVRLGPEPTGPLQEQ